MVWNPILRLSGIGFLQFCEILLALAKNSLCFIHFRFQHVSFSLPRFLQLRRRHRPMMVNIAAIGPAAL